LVFGFWFRGASVVVNKTRAIVAVLLLVCIFVYILSGFQPGKVSLLFDLFLVVLLFGVFIFVGGAIFSPIFMLVCVCSFYAIFGAIIYGERHFFYNYNFEILRSSRFIFYLIIFVGLSEAVRGAQGLRFINVGHLRRALEVLVPIFLLTYFVQMVVFGNGRPYLFSESNFEMPFLVGIFIILFYYEGRQSLYVRVMAVSIFVIVLLSLSKSAILMFFVSMVVLTIRRITFGGVALFAFLLISVVSMFIIRSGDKSFEEMDRFQFLVVLYDAMSGLKLSDVLFGSGVASLMPLESCLKLVFWANHINEEGYVCNSTPLHSFLMRSTWDIGLVFTMLYIFMWYYYLKILHGLRLALALLSVALISSLSVSGFSNSIIIFPLFLSLFVSHNENRQ
jgi:hypothetical protein